MVPMVLRLGQLRAVEVAVLPDTLQRVATLAPARAVQGPHPAVLAVLVLV